MHPIAIAKGVQEPTHDQFRLRPFASDGAHIRAAASWR